METNVGTVKVVGLSKAYLKALINEEKVAVTMYDVDAKLAVRKTVSGRGGNATIGIGHLIHYGAIGSTQYDEHALDKEKEFKNEISLDEVFKMFNSDLPWRMDEVNRWLKIKNITDADEDVVDVFFDFEYNAGNPIRAMNFYKAGGVLGLYQAIKRNNKETGILNVNIDRRNMRLRFLKEPLKKENFNRGVDDPMRINPPKKDEGTALNSIMIFKDCILIKKTNPRTHKVVLRFVFI
jgi:hypothetical protein